MSRERLQKALSAAGVASRRAAERLIVAGRVSVNGRIVRELGTKVGANDALRVDGKRVDRGRRRHYILLNKPRGVICTMSDPEGRPSVSELVPDRFGRVYPVGRLDYNSEGALLMTDDGELAHRLTHPRFGVERLYVVKVRGLIPPNDPRIEEISGGVQLDDGSTAQVKRVRVGKQTKSNTWLEMVLTEGKNREIRRICEALKLDVLRLLRLAYGPILLAGLKPRAWRELSAAEVHKLKKLVST